MRSLHNGFTLIELMVVIAIGTLVMAIGVPSFTYITNSSRLSGEMNGLVGDLQFARSEAIKQGQTVSVCISSDGVTCLDTGNWQSGWIVFSDPTGAGTHAAGGTPVLRRQASFSNKDTFAASDTVSVVKFNREGFAIGLPTDPVTVTLHEQSNNAKWSRCLAINIVGRTSIQTPGTGDCK